MIFLVLLSIVQAGATILWDLIVGGGDVDYWLEFIPSAQGSYETLIDKKKTLSSSDLVISTYNNH